MQRTLIAFSLAGAAGQQRGYDDDVHLPMPVEKCSKRFGCWQERTSVTLDANWRWTHNVDGYENCQGPQGWVEKHCPDPETCSKNCAVEGIDEAGWDINYGVTTILNGSNYGVKLKYVPGSRMYLLDSVNTYKMFVLKNREFTVDIDMSTLPCGVNGALYFVEMEKDGGVASSNGLNKAGAEYGAGYCDAQCPTDIHFIDGYANVGGGYGSCCSEMDIWEANSLATSYTPHPCNIDVPERVKCDGEMCNGGKCDQPGCDFNPYRTGVANFYGPGSEFALNTKKQFTVVTQFHTSDGTDDGDVVEIRRLYVQDGKVIKNPAASFPGLSAYDSITDDICAEQKAYFNATGPNEFKDMGGMKQMSDALGRGMVLTLSVWDDAKGDMMWLDGTDPANSIEPGAARGPCPSDTGDPKETREANPYAYVTYSKIRYGEIGSTTKSHRHRGHRRRGSVARRRRRRSVDGFSNETIV